MRFTLDLTDSSRIPPGWEKGAPNQKRALRKLRNDYEISCLENPFAFGVFLCVLF
jgi:hypothetical protein